MLVAGAFLGLRPSGHEINHKSGDKLDNSASNLEYVTQAANMAHAVRTGLHTKGVNHAKAKLTEAEVREIFFGAENHTITARHYGVCAQNVRAIRRREIWKHLNLHHEMRPLERSPSDSTD